MHLRFLALFSIFLLATGCGDDAGSSSTGDADAAASDRDGSVRAARDASSSATLGASCDSDNDCTRAGLLCDRVASRCVQCVVDLDCGASQGCASGECVTITPCKNSLACIDAPEGLSICDRARERCVQCVAAPDCDDGQECEANRCVMVQRCDTSLDCDSGQVCDTRTSRCVGCLGAVDCGSGQICGVDQRCRPGCDSDNDCTPLGQLCDRAAGHCAEPVGGARGTARDVHFESLDLLFVVDNSGSMREEQAALRLQFPRLIRVLTSGDRDLDGVSDFPAMTDVHLAVVSADMGLFGISGVPSCDGVGDDGIMQNQPGPGATGCQPSYPRFLSYDATADNPASAAQDFGCIATLGTDGCGFEQQLEASLKALWPSTGTGISFLGPTQGQGDGPNAGFLRSDPDEGLSLISVIVVSDEEDCSAQDTRIFTLSTELPAGDPLLSQGLNTRCFNNKAALYDVRRYIDGLRSLRTGLEELVTFGAIVGVPPDLVSATRRAAVDFSDATERDAYYDGILKDSRMVEAINNPGLPPDMQNLLPSCDTPTGRAYPPRRIVEVARGFGENGIVQSICEEDFTGAMDAIIQAIIRTR